MIDKDLLKNNLTTEEVVLNALELKNAIPSNVVEVSNLEKEKIEKLQNSKKLLIF